MMNKLLCCLCLLVPFAGHAQDSKPVAQRVAAYKEAGKPFLQAAPLVKNAATVASEEYDAVLSDATFLTLDIGDLGKLLTKSQAGLALSLPYKQAGMILELVEVSLHTEDFTVLTNLSDGTPVPYTPGRHYRGIVRNNDQSTVSLSIFPEGIMGMITMPEEGTLVLGKLEIPGNSTDYILYKTSDLLVGSNFECHTGDLPTEGPAPEQLSPPNPGQAKMTDCVRIFLEADYDLYVNKGGVQQTVDYLSGMFNQVATLYANESIPVSFSQSYVWISQDPYSTASSSDALNLFRTTRTTFNGDLAALTVIGGNNTGGLAYLDVLCNNSYKYSYSDIETSYSTVPTYSWTVEVLTHELGHNFGSRHTHACVWNGNNTPIDCCGYNAGYTEESTCGSGYSCTVPNPSSGTIMSYCHLIGGVGIDFNLGFGTQPGDLIRAKYNAAACLTSCTGASCDSVTQLAVGSIGSDEATVSWTAAAGAVDYTVRYKLDAETSYTSVTTASTSYTMTGLTTSASYNVEVQTNCSGSSSGFVNGIVFTTLLECPPPATIAQSSANPVCSGVSFTLSLGTAYGIGYTFQWQSSADGLTYTDMPSATASTLVTSQSAATWYRCTVTCGASQSIQSTALQVLLDSPTNCYCIPESTICSGFSPSPYMRINSVTLGSLSNANNSCSTNGYGDYSSGQTVPDVTIGGGSVLTVSCEDYELRIKVYIDYNRDGDLEDANEAIEIPYVAGSGGLTVSQAINPPAGTTSGTTRMRIRGRYWGDSAYPPGPCTGNHWGETEDYTINLVECSGTCYALPTASNCENPNIMRINRVQLGTLDNNNSSCGGNNAGFEDYTTGQTVPTLLPEQSYTLTVTVGNFPQYVTAYIDYNGNGSFNDAGESIPIPYTGASAQSVNFTVPAGIANGQYRMRIRSSYYAQGAPPNAYDILASDNLGETEDYTVQLGAALPAELLSFRALPATSGGAELYWETASEQNVSHFTVQHSRDGQHFDDIRDVLATGGPADPTAYRLTDDRVRTGRHYYRLMVVDNDGTHTYSELAVVDLPAEGMPFHLYGISPNPAAEEVTVHYHRAQDGKVRFTLYDITGRIVLEASADASAGDNHSLLDIRRLSSGVYLLAVDDGQNLHSLRLLK
ncbi:MAG: hypothetical protein RLY31_3089 [Bacteroidota bacterium]